MYEERMGFMPTALVLPLRDAARGVGSLAHHSRRALRPSAALLPDALREFAHEVIERAEEVGRHTPFRRQPGASDIAAACAVLEGGMTLPHGAGRLALALAYGLEKAFAADHGQQPPLISETVLALAATEALRGAGADTDGAMRGALLVTRLARAPISVPLSGPPLVAEAPERVRMRKGLFAVVLWLLAERPEEGVTEDEILELAIGLTGAVDAEIGDALEEPESTAAELHRLADML